MAEIIYKRLDNRGEIHAVENGNTHTLCGENCQTWKQVSEPGARHPSACPDCAEIIEEMNKPAEKKKKPSKKESTSKESNEQKEEAAKQTSSSDTDESE